MDLTALTRFQPFFAQLAHTTLAPWVEPLAVAVRERLAARTHGDLVRWEAALAALPDLPPGRVVLDHAAVGLQSDQVLAPAIAAHLRATLMQLHPWRKGPFCFHDMHLDAEWRSDWKWARLADAIDSLTGRVVLDVGCGNGYYAWRMRGAGARLVMGIDPTQLFVCQFRALQHYLQCPQVAVLPLGIEDLPFGLSGFDTVFSMGVLSHRRSPLDHLAELRTLLRPGGQLVLETLVLDCTEQQVLVPPDRYAQMRNIWFIPSVAALVAWMKRLGFQQVSVVAVTRTTIAEQRATDWMHFQSLPDHLDPADPSRTIEGHPAPVRAVVIGRA